MLIGDRISSLALQKGITPYRIAKDADISQSYLSELISNKRSNPSLAVLKKIATALGIPTEKLIN